MRPRNLYDAPFNYFSICRTSLEIGADGETCTPAGRNARQFTKLMLSLLSHIGEHDAKAESNRRSQACEVLAGTGVRVALNLEAC